MLCFMVFVFCFVLFIVVYVVLFKDFELSKMLEKVVKESSVGIFCVINEDIFDQGYIVEGNQLINYFSVCVSYVECMCFNLDSVCSQFGDSVCSNIGYCQLFVCGVIFIYSFIEYKINQLVVIECFDVGSCCIQGKK